MALPRRLARHHGPDESGVSQRREHAARVRGRAGSRRQQLRARAGPSRSSAANVSRCSTILLLPKENRSDDHNHQLGMSTLKGAMIRAQAGLLEAYIAIARDVLTASDFWAAPVRKTAGGPTPAGSTQASRSRPRPRAEGAGCRQQHGANRQRRRLQLGLDTRPAPGRTSEGSFAEAARKRTKIASLVVMAGGDP